MGEGPPLPPTIFVHSSFGHSNPPLYSGGQGGVSLTSFFFFSSNSHSFPQSPIPPLTGRKSALHARPQVIPILGGLCDLGVFIQETTSGAENSESLDGFPARSLSCDRTDWRRKCNGRKDGCRERVSWVKDTPLAPPEYRGRMIREGRDGSERRDAPPYDETTEPSHDRPRPSAGGRRDAGGLLPVGCRILQRMAAGKRRIFQFIAEE